MKIFIKLLLTVLFCSIASINAMNNGDEDLARAIAQSEQQIEQDALKRATAENERAFKLEQERRAAHDYRFNNIYVELDSTLVLEAGRGNKTKVKELIAQGAFIDAIAQDNVTPLLATLQGAMVRMSLDAAGNFHEDYHELVKYFLDQGANVNHQDIRGNTPLMHAVFLSPSVFKTILDKNPDLMLVNKNSETILKLIQTTQASRDANPEVQKILKFDEKLAILQAHLRKFEHTTKAQIEAQARPILNSVVIPALTNLIMDYVEGEYPLSDQMQLPFVPKEKAKKSGGFAKADTGK